MEGLFHRRKLRNGSNIMNLQESANDSERTTIASPYFKKTSKHVINSNEPRIASEDLSKIRDVYIEDAALDPSPEEPQIDGVDYFSDAEHDLEWESTQMRKGLPHKTLNLLPIMAPSEPTMKISEIEAELICQITTLNQQLLILCSEKNKIPKHDPSYLSCLDFLYKYVQNDPTVSDGTPTLEQFSPADILTAFESSELADEYLPRLFELPLMDYIHKNQISDSNMGVQSFLDSNSLPASLLTDLIKYVDRCL